MSTSSSALLPARNEFFAKYCVDCHGATEPKAGLRLDTPPSDVDGVEAFRTWTKILDRVAAKEMPPKDAPQPTPEDRAKFTAALNETLLAADRRRQLPPGSLVLRRLNRLQYENTIRDLLDLELELQDRLPADGRALGFDNVGAALSLSSAQLEAYLDAADAVLDASIALRTRPQGVKDRFTHLSRIVDKSYRPNGHIFDIEEASVCFGRFSFNVGRAPVEEEGRYRLRMSLYGYQSGGKPLEIYVQSSHKTGDDVIGYYNVPPDVPQVLEIICTLKKGARITVSTSKLNYVKRARNIEEHTTPGLAVQWIEFEGPLLDAWPPRSHVALFGDLPMRAVSRDGKVLTVDSKQPREDAQRLLAPFMRKAYRRPVTADEVQAVVALVAEQLDSGVDFVESMRVGYKAILCSPDFLFFQESPGDADEFALASRLSYFLWNTLPDEELLRLAEAKVLGRPETLRAQVERLLNDPRSQRFVQNFLDQWLDLRLIDFTTPDRKLYPEFDLALREAMVDETQCFFTDAVRQDRSLLNFIDSDYTFLNERLAKHYGIEGVEGTAMRRVALPEGSHRGGIITMASVMKVTANGSYTHPVHRGVWMLRNIVGRPPDPPPPNAGAIEPDLRGAKTIREQLNIHRQAESCAGCHVKIDPLGFALENFDVAGGWREKYRILSGEKLSLSMNGPPVEAAYEMPDGRPFRNIDELKQLLLEDKPQLARCLTEKLLVYATGKGLSFSDRTEVARIVSAVERKDYGVRSLIHEIVQSSLFRN